jgi:hypothetical protein
LLDRFGKHMHHNLAAALFPDIVADVLLEFQLTNQHGRVVYQYSSFSGDGSSKTQIVSRRRKNGS